nr:hypothetical protein [Tanacetum cinerariifolium]
GVIDSGCSYHMTWNMSYLSDFEELNGRYVTFGGNPKGGKISGKGKLRQGNKNSVLFTDTECLVLSPDFKLPDESQGNPQYALKDKGVIDSGCSYHMTWNMSYLSDFEELNGRYVTFGGNPKGGKISGDWLRVMCRLMGDLDLVIIGWASLGRVTMILATAALTGLTAVIDTGLD